MDTLGTQHFVLCREVVLFQRSVYTRVLLVCPLFGGLSSLGVSFIGGFTVEGYQCTHHNIYSLTLLVDWPVPHWIYHQTTEHHDTGQIGKTSP